ncbi:hypothetical protein C8R45DRAFT_991431 [Mycena sanguinolenta]|nr:hypothetical protein C8R45DRAFT_991431 [Mycena sanguinolenta]
MRTALALLSLALVLGGSRPTVERIMSRNLYELEGACVANPESPLRGTLRMRSHECRISGGCLLTFLHLSDQGRQLLHTHCVETLCSQRV